MVPEDVLARYPIYSHDCDDRGNLVFTGRTTRGTQVWTNKRYVDAQLRICIGDIEAHQFMGFSGGVKSAAVGLTSRETINHNHTMMTHPLARAGGYEDNPVRQDLEEIGKLIGIHFALNSILNEQKQIVRVLAGDPVAVMEAGVPLVRELYGIVVDRALDLVVVSPGGHPKDINLYQAQKGLAHACLVTKECGAVVVAAACPEGSGSAGYERWMEGMTSHQAVLDRFAREDFRIGPHKGFQVARDSMCRRVIWVSDQPDQTVSRWLLEPAPDVQTAVERIFPDLPADARIGIMPAGNTTIPKIR